jgi:hypothetical protein
LLATTAFEHLSLADARTHILCDAFRCEDSNYPNIPPDAGVVSDPLHT